MAESGLFFCQRLSGAVDIQPATASGGVGDSVELRLVHAPVRVKVHERGLHKFGVLNPVEARTLASPSVPLGSRLLAPSVRMTSLMRGVGNAVWVCSSFRARQAA